MLRVLHVYKDYCPPIFGGIEKELALLCDELSSVMDVSVLVANRGSGTDVDVVNGVRVQKVGCRWRFLSAPVAPLFPYYLGRQRADIYHFHLPNPTAVISHLIARPSGLDSSSGRALLIHVWALATASR